MTEVGKPASNETPEQPGEGGGGYPGDELTLFGQAYNWKSYIFNLVLPALGEKVLEVGAGIGSTTLALFPGRAKRWVCLEPDKGNFEALVRLCASGELPKVCEPRWGTVNDLEPNGLFDTILYIDVLEHIDDDAEEVRVAVSRLGAKGRLVVLCPAHNWLFSEFDRSIGHYRRYDKTMMKALPTSGLVLESLRYLDAVGLAASSANRMLLRQAMPTHAQVQLWDRMMVPASRVVDRMIGFTVGKSVLGIWQRSEPAERVAPNHFPRA